MPPSNAIAAVGLTKRYGGDEVVKDLTFTVAPGKVTGFLGPNGAGKTTTIRMILGLIRPTAGTAMVHGRPFRDLDDPARHVGVLIEGAQAHPGRTAHDHLRVLATERNVDAGEIDQALDRVHLTDHGHKKVRDFSLGMRQRLDLAAALLGDPRALILDEPANGLDPAGIRWLREFLRSFVADGRTVLVSSHQLAETSQLADDAIVINHGRLIAHTSVADLTAHHTVRVRSPQVPVLEAALNRSGTQIRRTATDTIEIAGLPIEEIGQVAAEASLVLHELSLQTTTLEDVFLELTNTGARP